MLTLAKTSPCFTPILAAPVPAGSVFATPSPCRDFVQDSGLGSRFCLTRNREGAKDGGTVFSGESDKTIRFLRRGLSVSDGCLNKHWRRHASCPAAIPAQPASESVQVLFPNPRQDGTTCRRSETSARALCASAWFAKCLRQRTACSGSTLLPRAYAGAPQPKPRCNSLVSAACAYAKEYRTKVLDAM